MSLLSDELQRTNKALLAARGESVTFRRVTEGSYDPSAGTTSGDTTDDETVTVSFIDYRDDQIDDGFIQRGDRMALLNADGVSKVPQIGDQFVGANDTVNVVNARELRLGGSAIVYQCQVRE